MVRHVNTALPTWFFSLQKQGRIEKLESRCQKLYHESCIDLDGIIMKK